MDLHKMAVKIPSGNCGSVSDMEPLPTASAGSGAIAIEAMAVGCSADDALRHEYLHVAALRGDGAAKSNASQLEQPVGLALSGGGIRSATLSLGVLQALAEARVLRRFDYLSTISGGGYIGSWFSAILQSKHLAKEPDPIGATERLLWPGAALEPGREAAEISFLRSYSNYLTPRLGLFSADTLAAFTGYIRNLALSLLLALATGALSISLLHAMTSVVASLACSWSQMQPTVVGGARWFLLIAIGCAALLLTLQSLDPRARLPAGTMRKPMLDSIQQLHAVVGGALLYVAALGLLLAGIVLELAPRSVIGITEVMEFGGLALVAMMIGAWIAFLLIEVLEEIASAADDSSVLSLAKKLGGIGLDWPGHPMRLLSKRWREALRYGVAVVACSVVATGLLAWCLSLAPVSPLVALFRGPLLATLVAAILAVVWLGAVGTMYAEPSREWLSRLLGTVVGLMLAWAALGALLLYARPALFWIADGRWLALIPAAWILPAAAFFLLAVLSRQRRSISASSVGMPARAQRNLLLLACAFVSLLFIATLVALLQEGLLRATQLESLSGGSWHALVAKHEVAMTAMLRPVAAGLPPVPSFTEFNLSILHLTPWVDWAEKLWAWAPSFLVLLMALLATLLCFWVIDVNVFSLQNLYRNRLVRCYLGAARHSTRMQNPYAGFDPADDLPLSSLALQRPMHLVNAALNITHGDDLALQQRKAASFCFNPLFCGYWLGASSFGKRGPKGGYVLTADYAVEPASAGDHSKGVMLGTAMATSGAAVSSQMGFASSGLLAFVLTLFNVRLGRWFPNTTPGKSAKQRARHSPGFAAAWYLQELLGRTNEKSAWIYLSDGGHFDNLGVYELVRRRCKLIVAVDGGADPSMDFADLGNCVRKCRVDFGVEIDMDPTAFGWDKTQRRCSASHVVGRVRYPRKDAMEAFEGAIVYIKASLPMTGGMLPADVSAFAAAEPQFPHQPTADQWFTESQFESYRQLGQWLGRSAIAELCTLLAAVGTSAPPSNSSPHETAGSTR